MKVLWQKSPLTANEVVDSPAISHVMHPQMARTLLNRLVKKKVLGFRREGRAYSYYPLAAESECVTAATESFLARVFGGSLKPMIAHFVEHDKLSQRERDELRALLRRKKK